MHKQSATPVGKDYSLGIFISVATSALAFLTLVNVQQIEGDIEEASILNFLVTLIPVMIFTLLQVYARTEKKRVVFGVFLIYLGFIFFITGTLNNILSFHAHATPDFQYAFPIACINYIPAVIYGIYSTIQIRRDRRWYEANQEQSMETS